MRINGVKLLALCLFCLLFGVETTLAQGNKPDAGAKLNYFRGVVIDDEDEPLPGVTVMIVGKKGNGVATNENGEFAIGLKDKTCTLRFTYIGMKPQEVRAQAGKSVTVRLETDAATMDEVVVNGIYTRNIESFTGTVSTFNADQLKTIAPQGVIKSLALLDPSVILTENVDFGSDPNKLADISINGKMNVQALSQEYETDPNQPLFILDGFESSLQAISDLNMDRVESISVLKDASATAIYGSKAANGVIVVETKKPTAGRLRLSYNGSVQVAWADLSDYNLMNAAQKLEFERLSGVYNYNPVGAPSVGLDENGLPISEPQRELYLERLRLVKEGYNTYWMNEPLRTAVTQSHNVYIEGGDQAFRYGAGLSYNNTQGVMKKSDRDVINGNITLSYRVDNFNFSNQTTISHTGSNQETVAFSRFAQMNPFYTKYTEDGQVAKYVYKDTSAGGETIWNPMWDLRQNSYRKGDIIAITDNFQFEWRATRQLRIRGNLQYSTSKTTNETYVSPNETSQDGLEQLKRGSYTNANSSNNRYSGRINASYGAYWGIHTLNAVGGMQVSDSRTKSHSYGVQGYLNDQFSNPNFSVGYPEGGKPSSSDTHSRNVSYYANLNYAWDMRYLLDFNLSRSGASQFGIDDPFTTTWSVGVGWNAHNEKWFKPNKYISYLKINASYGNPGNQNYDAKLASSIYEYYTAYTNPFGLAAIVNQWGNSGLKWQKTDTYNVGLNVNMFDQKLMLSTSYQIRMTDPLLVRIDLPSSTGATSAPMNIGGTDNRSWSLNATYYVFRRGDLNWYFSGNINTNRTKYYKIGDLLEQYNEAGRGSKSLERMYDGASTTGLYIVRSAGIDPATGNEIFIRKDGTYTYEWSADDEVLYGDTNPDFSGTLSTSFLYKGFSVGATFSFRSGAEVYLSTLMNKVENISNTSLKYNQDLRALTDRWKKPGDIAKYKRIDDTSATNQSSRFVATEHTLDCASINFGYRTTTMPFLRTIGASSFDIRFYMNDLFHLSNIKEERGLSYPFQRSFSLSLGLSF
ncbi:MAG: SusC/RagA family TonB-linked outer membrane protein [Duncaniella sp.]|uniref:SusC/RagA family TonB-linked outer membrane protein n=1 Tax=Duncaniella sp. TaxID=2518496 RepID=UPI0023D4AA3E|nr:SusC/RagA family TonB-linked outer membrane protein [Duncaniella sp.]MDE5988137.1 SusC/RagA family TonB-linked outer membrane protein [Duncaniella sp.]MDE6175515.1 SusC/RagA family TonB-linked outer membrane protein [Duncaniella sp.]